MFDFPFDTEALCAKWFKLRMLPRNDFEKQSILIRLVSMLEDRTYTEDELNRFLAERFDDHVLVRRELVNFGYLGKDPYEGTYKVAKRDLSIEDVRANTILARHAASYGVR